MQIYFILGGTTFGSLTSVYKLGASSVAPVTKAYVEEVSCTLCIYLALKIFEKTLYISFLSFLSVLSLIEESLKVTSGFKLRSQGY